MQKPADLNIYNVCENLSTKFYVQYQCVEGKNELAAKQHDGLVVTTIQMITVTVFLLGLLVNYITTRTVSKNYDAINFTAANFTGYIDVSAKHRRILRQKYNEQNQ